MTASGAQNDKPQTEPDETLPLLPDEILRVFDCHDTRDTRFRAAARLLQSIWRQDQQLACSQFKRANGSFQRSGSMLTHDAGRAGSNFLSPEIATLVRREVIYREIGACMDTDRLYRNLLSSMPLAFNLFGPLKLDLDFATNVMQLIIPSFHGKVTDVLFEHSPGRGSPAFTADYTAFDVFIKYQNEDKSTGFVAVEQKYTESLHETATKTRPHLDQLASRSALFKNADDPELRKNPCQQLWREHLLAQSLVQEGLYSEGHFVVLAPRLNWQVQNGISTYQAKLSRHPCANPTFLNVYIERLIEAMSTAGQPTLAAELFQRYCDFAKIDRLVDDFVDAEHHHILANHKMASTGTSEAQQG